MSEYQEILAQIVALQDRADAIHAAERAAAIENIKSLLATYDISLSELSSKTIASPRLRDQKIKAQVKKIPPKYRDGTGNEWTGRGLRPRWLKSALANGVSLESLQI